MNADLEPYPAMKGSGVDWLGEVPEHWTEKRAKYFYREVDERSTTGDEELMSVSHKTGVTPRKKSVTMFMAESNVGHRVCQPDDIAINTMWAFMGALGVAQQVGLVSPSYGVYRPVASGVLMPEYIDRVLRIDSYKSEYMCRSTGINSSRLRLYPDEFLRIPIICPPLPEQAAIVRYLDHMDRRVRRLVRAKRKLIALLTEQNRAIIHQAVTRGLDPNVPLKDSGVEWLGDAPAHWEVRRVKQCAKTISKGTTPSTEGCEILDSGPVRFLKAENITSLGIQDTPLCFIDEDTDRTLKRSRLHFGDVLFVIAGATLGKTSIVSEGILPANTNQAVAFIRPNSRIVPRYLEFWLQTPRLEEQIWLNAVQSAQPNLSMADLGEFACPLPSRSEQMTIVEYLDTASADIGRAVSQAKREIELVGEYRTRLIADVVTGKLDVREAAAALPKVDPFATEDDVDDALDHDSDDNLDSVPEAAEA